MGQFRHKSVGAVITQTEFEQAGTGHEFASQATGNIPYASSSTVLEGLTIGAAGSVLMSTGSIPTWTHQGLTSDLIFNDGVDCSLGTGGDVLIRWSTGDADNHSLVIGLGDSNQGVHITDKTAIATDWDVPATTHPNVYIHSNTTPPDDYLRLGGHDGTTAYIDNVGGTTLAFQIDGTSELTLTATLLSPVSDATTDLGTTTVGFNDLHLGSGGVINCDGGDVILTHSAGTLTVGGDGAVVIALTANTDLSFTGTTGTNDITLTDSLADALSITRGGTDMVVFNSSTPSITFTPAVTFSGAVDIQGGYANGGGAPYDGVVDAGGGGNWTTIQAGDDALDGGDYTMLVKQGTYAENVIVSTNDVHIVVEPGTDIQGSVTLSGANIKLSLGPNCDLDGIIVSGDSCLVDGGGWSTISNGGTARIGISVTGSDVIVQNIAAQTTEDGGASYNAIDFVTGARGIVRNCKVITSDGGAALNAEQAEMLVQGNYIATSDSTGIRVGAARNRIIGNFVNDAGSNEWSIDVNGNGDNSLIVGNITKDPGTTNYNINLRVNGDNCIMDGNRTDGTNTDSSTGSTVGDNETTTF